VNLRNSHPNWFFRVFLDSFSEFQRTPAALSCDIALNSESHSTNTWDTGKELERDTLINQAFKGYKCLFG
jgi:hypothetical protein